MAGKLKVGVIGAGMIANAGHIPGWKSLCDEVEVVAVANPNKAKAQLTANNEGIQRVYDDWRQMLVDVEPDIVSVCTPNVFHCEQAIAAFEAGAHVFCEKPPGRDLEEIANVIRCEKGNPELKLKYGFNHRYHDSVREALQIVRSGELGQVINLRAVYGKSQMVTFGSDSDWRTERALAGGGILLDQGIHMVDLLRLFAGEFDDINSYISNAYWGHEVEDNAYALMRSSTGVVAMLHSSATQWRHRFNLDITLERGTLILQGILSGSKSYGQEQLIVSRNTGDDRGNPAEELIEYNLDNSWKDEIEDFARAIKNDGEIVNGCSIDAFNTMKLVYRIYCADADWRKKWGLTDDIELDYQ